MKNDGNKPIAIIGISCRLPNSDNLEEFWNLLMDKKDGMQNIPKHRWIEEHTFLNYKKNEEMQAGFLKCPIDEFDSNFFAMSPMELGYTDPQQRLLLEVCWESLEDAGINPLSIHGTRTGIY